MSLPGPILDADGSKTWLAAPSRLTPYGDMWTQQRAIRTSLECAATTAAKPEQVALSECPPSEAAARCCAMQQRCIVTRCPFRKTYTNAIRSYTRAQCAPLTGRSWLLRHSHRGPSAEQPARRSASPPSGSHRPLSGPPWRPARSRPPAAPAPLRASSAGCATRGRLHHPFVRTWHGRQNRDLSSGVGRGPSRSPMDDSPARDWGHFEGIAFVSSVMYIFTESMRRHDAKVANARWGPQEGRVKGGTAAHGSC